MSMIIIVFYLDFIWLKLNKLSKNARKYGPWHLGLTWPIKRTQIWCEVQQISPGSCKGKNGKRITQNGMFFNFLILLSKPCLMVDPCHVYQAIILLYKYIAKMQAKDTHKLPHEALKISNFFSKLQEFASHRPSAFSPNQALRSVLEHS